MILLILQFVKDCYEDRSQLGVDGLACYQYPPEVELKKELPENTAKKLIDKNGKLTVMIAIWSIRYTIPV